MGTVENIYLSNIAQVNEMLQSRMPGAGISSSNFQDIMPQTLEQTSKAAQSAAAQSGPASVASYNKASADSEDEYSRIPERAGNHIDNVVKNYVHYSNRA